jgi:FkbM family methyltransferase
MTIPTTISKIQKKYEPPRIVTLFKINPCGCQFELLTPTEHYRTVRYGGELEFTKMMVDSLHREDIFYDIGACVGLVAIHAARRCQHVFAFEPDPYYQNRLSRNIKLNGLTNIEVISWAVSQESGTVGLYTSGEGENAPCLKPIGHEHAVLVKVNSIDNAIAEGSIPAPHVIKIDIEGAETDALAGMERLLLSKKAPRKIFLEIHPRMLSVFNSSQEDVFERLRNSGYIPVFIRHREEQWHAVFFKMDSANHAGEGRSTSLHKGPPFSRNLTTCDEDIFINCWKHALNMQVSKTYLSQLERGIIGYEKKAKGRLAGDIQDAILRILVASSLDTDILNILEIGVLFGVNAICCYKLTDHRYSRKHITLVDSLNGYYRPGEMDCLTKLPVNRDTLEFNLSTATVPTSDYTIVEGLSTNPSTIQKVSDSLYQIVFIDGDHSYEGIKVDYENYSGLVAENGYLIFDNYRDGTSPGVDRFIDELLESYSAFELIGISWRTAVFRRKKYDLVDLEQKYSRLKQKYECQELLIEKCDKAIREHEGLHFEIICSSIRKRWSSLSNYENIKTVFLIADKTQVNQLLKALEGVVGPTILGVIDPDSQDGQNVDGYPMIKPEEASEISFDAIVLLTRMDQEKLTLACHELCPQGKRVIDLYEGIPTIHQLDRPSLEYLRHKREMYQKLGDVDKSLRTTMTILDHSPDEEDFEKFYRAGLTFHKQNDLHRARAVYEKVASDERIQPDLSAWALFKHGEIFLDQGDEEKAKNYFKQTLERNPKHTKATIYLTPENSPLRVGLGEGAHYKDCIKVPMGPLDAELWTYYFTRRKPDYVELQIDTMLLEDEWSKLADLLMDYLAADGEAVIRVPGNHDRQGIELIAVSLRVAGLCAEVVNEDVIRVRV